MTFTIPGDPRGWRQNHTARGRGTTSYLVDNAKAWQKNAIALMRFAWGCRPPMDGASCVRVEGVFARPQRLDCPHKRACSCGPEMRSGESVPHLTTPDATNVHKLAEDALVKAGVLLDDRYVCEYSGAMRYAANNEQPHVRVTVEGVE